MFLNKHCVVATEDNNVSCRRRKSFCHESF